MQTFKTWNEDWALSQRQNTSRNTQSCSTQSLSAFYQNCKKAGNSWWGVPAKKPRNHFCKGFSKEMKMFQIIRELSGFSLSSEQFNNDIKISIAFSFPFFPSSLQSFRRVFFHKSKYQKARKAQNQFASNAFTSSTYRERHTEPLAQQTWSSQSWTQWTLAGEAYNFHGRWFDLLLSWAKNNTRPSSWVGVTHKKAAKLF